MRQTQIPNQVRHQVACADVDAIFTPHVLAELDDAAAEARKGKTFSGEQVDEFLAENRTEWLKSRRA